VSNIVFPMMFVDDTTLVYFILLNLASNLFLKEVLVNKREVRTAIMHCFLIWD